MVDLFKVLLLLGEGGVVTEDLIHCLSTAFKLAFKVNDLGGERLGEIQPTPTTHNHNKKTTKKHEKKKKTI